MPDSGYPNGALVVVNSMARKRVILTFGQHIPISLELTKLWPVIGLFACGKNDHNIRG
jgi:hypothetical protein